MRQDWMQCPSVDRPRRNDGKMTQELVIGQAWRELMSGNNVGDIVEVAEFRAAHDLANDRHKLTTRGLHIKLASNTRAAKARPWGQPIEMEELPRSGGRPRRRLSNNQG